MQIFLNGNEIGFTLNEEKFLSDVLIRLKKWMSDNGLFIDSVTVDNKLYDNDNYTNLCDVKLDEVKRIDVEAFSRLEIEYIQYSVIKNYFQDLIKAIDEKNTEKLESLAEEYEEIQATLALNIKFVQDKDKKMETMLKSPLDENNIQEIKNAAESIVKLCQEGLGELDKIARGDKKTLD